MKCCKQKNNSACGHKSKQLTGNRDCPCMYISQADDFYFDTRNADKTSSSLKSSLHSEINYIDLSLYFKKMYHDNDLPPQKEEPGHIS